MVVLINSILILRLFTYTRTFFSTYFIVVLKYRFNTQYHAGDPMIHIIFQELCVVLTQ